MKTFAPNPSLPLEEQLSQLLQHHIDETTSLYSHIRDLKENIKILERERDDLLSEVQSLENKLEYETYGPEISDYY